MNEVKEQLYNPLKNLIFGGRLSGDNLVYTGTPVSYTHLKAVQKQFSNWFAEMFKKTDEAVARRVLKYMHVDSWEAALPIIVWRLHKNM